MTGRCWWPTTGDVNLRSSGVQVQERDTKSRIVKVDACGGDPMEMWLVLIYVMLGFYGLL